MKKMANTSFLLHTFVDVGLQKDIQRERERERERERKRETNSISNRVIIIRGVFFCCNRCCCRYSTWDL